MKKALFLFANLFIINLLSTAQSVTLATTTVNPTKGTVYFNNGTNQLQYWNGSAWIPITNAADGTGWSLAGANLYTSNNVSNVGIGTTTPTTPLMIQTPAPATTYIGNTNYTGISQTDGSLRIGTNISHQQFNSPVITIPRGGIGTFTNHKFGIFANGNALSPDIEITPGYVVQIGGSNTPDVYMPSHLGIGSFINTQIPLYVGYGTNSSTGLSSYFYPSSTTDFTHVNNSTLSASIYAVGGIVSGSYIGAVQSFTASDNRIKNIIDKSNSVEDLATLNKFQVTNYTMKDKAKFGDKTFKKVIAQEIEKVYPQAVTLNSSVIPDIYTLAEKIIFDEPNKKLNISLSKNYEIKIGDKIEFIHEKAGKIKAEVIEVAGNSFTVKDWQYPTDKIFVYGREVNDFRSVDYEAISMLGISAIQQLAKENEALKTKFTTENDLLKKQIADLNIRFEHLEAMITKEIKTIEKLNN